MSEAAAAASSAPRNRGTSSSARADGDAADVERVAHLAVERTRSRWLRTVRRRRRVRRPATPRRCRARSRAYRPAGRRRRVDRPPDPSHGRRRAPGAGRRTGPIRRRAKRERTSDSVPSGSPLAAIAGPTACSTIASAVPRASEPIRITTRVAGAHHTGGVGEDVRATLEHEADHAERSAAGLDGPPVVGDRRRGRRRDAAASAASRAARRPCRRASSATTSGGSSIALQPSPRRRRAGWPRGSGRRLCRRRDGRRRRRRTWRSARRSRRRER